VLAKLLPRNEHVLDRILRVTLGIGLTALAVTGPQVLWGWLGLIPLVTGLVGSCPIYSALGIGTCKVRPRG